MSLQAVPSSSVTNIAEVNDSQDKFLRAIDRLHEKRFPVTVAFFDLVGSTGYRVDSGLEAGLSKAARHNFIVSHAIQSNGGHVVKWMGDGVLGCFYDTENAVTPSHSGRALRAAVAAIETLKKHNEEARKGSAPYNVWRNDVVTRVGISSGPAHFIANAPSLVTKSQSALAGAKEETAPLFPWDLDPMGSCVDLAARLESLAGDFVILADRDTFWGYERETITGKVDRPVVGICDIPETQVPWRRLIIAGIRTTVYVPFAAPFFITPEKLISSRQFYSTEAIAPLDLIQLANEELSLKQRDHGELKVVYVSKPIQRNIRGFDQPVDVIAISDEPQEEPAKHAVHIPRSNQRINECLESGEKLFRSGKPQDIDGAIEQFRRAVERRGGDAEGERSEPRHFRANFRLAQLYLRKGNSEKAMEYLSCAKASDDRRAIAWKLAGIIHLGNFLRGTVVGENEVEPLTRAVAAFARARQLAYEALDGQIEQCCTALLVLCHYLRRKRGDAEAAIELLRELENWAPLTSTVHLLQPILQAFAEIASDNHDRFKIATDHLNSARVLLDSLSENSPIQRMVHDQNLLGTRDMELIIANANYELSVCDIMQRDRSTLGGSIGSSSIA
jgi:class 3 adenylate cyclase/tetratricopeptide (TPR) repeat protein